MTNRAKEMYKKFCEMFPYFVSEGQTVKEASPNVIIVNTAKGARGPKYTFIFRANGTWELHFN